MGVDSAIKLLNASKFVLGVGADASLAFDGSAVTEPLDRALLARLGEVVRDATKAFEQYNYARALEVTETFFWTFTDDYVELVKERAYGGHGDGPAIRQATLATALSVLHRLFAPVLPFVTEEVWSWWQPGTVHRQWPRPTRWRRSQLTASRAPGRGRAVLSEVRKAKSDAKSSMRTEVLRADVRGPAERVALLTGAGTDLAAAGRIAELTYADGADELTVHVELQEPTTS